MYLSLNSLAVPRFRASRGAALAGIVVMHVAAVAVAMTMKGPSADVEQQAPPIQVQMLTQPEQSRPPDVPVQPVQITEPQMIVPIIQINLPPPAPTAITVVAVAAPPPAPAPVAVSGDSDSPVAVSVVNYIRKPTSVYPPAAKRARAQGVVQVRALVDVDGHAREAKVHRSSGFDALDRAACDAVLAALFRPYMHNGVPRSMVVIVPITFALATRGGGDRGPPRGRDHDKDDLELDVRGEDHHAMRGHPEELGSLGTAALHVGE